MKRLIALLVISFLSAPWCSAVEELRWERVPLRVHLTVGQERVLFIERKVRIGVPTSVGDRLRVQTADNAVYLRASAPLPPTRLQLQDAATGALILLDISAEDPSPDQAPLEPLRILDSSTSRPPEQAVTRERRETASTTATDTPLSVTLTRYAAQSLYAPLRTVEPVAGVTLVPVPHNLPLDTLLPTLTVATRTLAAWRLDNEWVTAVQLTNTTDQWIDLDPRALQGDFVAATFQHPNLGPAGNSTDTTVVYLVTRGHGLADSLLPAISLVNTSPNLPPPSSAKDHSHKGETDRAQ